MTRSNTRDIQQKPLWKSDTSIKSKGEISLDLEAATGRDDEDSAYTNELQQHLMEDEQLLASMIQLANLSSRLLILKGSSDDISWAELVGLSEFQVSNVATRSATVVRSPRDDEVDVEVVVDLGTGSAAEGCKSEEKEPGTSNAVAISRLAHREVEDYRTRLQRKRASMLEIKGAKASGPKSISRTHSASDKLNGVLFENAVNASNVILLQRAMYTFQLQSHNNENVVTTATPDNEVVAERKAGKRAYSYDTGVDRMAADYLMNSHLSLLASATANNYDSTSQNAEWNRLSNTSNARSTVAISHPFQQLQSFAIQRQVTESGVAMSQFASMSQVGAFKVLEPGKLILLFLLLLKCVPDVNFLQHPCCSWESIQD